jgi:diacylglycerol kinase (ATP)
MTKEPKHMPWRKKERATLIYNPLAGPGTMDETIWEVARFWERRGWEVIIAPTEYAGHAVRLAQDAAEAGEYLVLAAGGDGTLGEVANGLAGTETIMGPLPIGTGNSFGKELRMPRPNLLDQKALIEAAALLASGRVHRMDLGRFRGGKYWMLWTGAGIDSFIVDEMEPRSKLTKRLGPAGYVAQAMAVAPRFAPMGARVTIDGDVYEDTYLLVLISNCRLYGGGELLLNADAALDDGQFEVFLFKGTGLPRTMTYLWQLWRGNHMGNDDVMMVRGSDVIVEPERPIPVHSDGDPAGETPIHCLVVPGALRLLVPRSAPHGLFRGQGLPL